MKKYLFGILLALVLVPGAFVSAQTLTIADLQRMIAELQAQLIALTTTNVNTSVSSDLLTVTPVVSTIVTQYNSAHPDTPDLKSLHTVKIKPSKNVKLMSVLTYFENSNGDRYTTIKTKRENKLDNVLIPSAGVDLQAGKEYYLSVTTTTDTNELFAGTYRSVLSSIGFNVSDGVSYEQVDLKTTQQVAVVGEKAPYITSVKPEVARPGYSIEIRGQRLLRGQVMLTSVSDGKSVVLKGDSSDDFFQFFVPINFVKGSYVLTVSNQYGVSNKRNLSVNQGNSGQSISNVNIGTIPNIDQGVVQGTSGVVSWSSTLISNVDILVCIKNGSCFSAYTNISSGPYGGKTTNDVRIGNNIPAGSEAFIRVRKTGDSSIFADSPRFIVKGQSTSVPIVTLSATPKTIVSDGKPGTVTLSWSSINAQRCVLKYGSTEENVSTNGSKTVLVAQTTSYTLWCANDPGTGKDGPSAEKTVTVNFQLTNITPKLADSGVSSPTGLTVVQGTNLTNLTWYTVGSIPTVDVLVCIQGGSCFYAQKGITNENGLAQIRVGTNIPVGSKVFVRVQQAGNPAVKIDSRTFDVVTPSVSQTSNAYFSIQTIIDNLSAVLNKE